MTTTKLQAINDVQPARETRYQVAFARNQDEIRETQALRYRIFAGEMGAQLEPEEPGLDSDRFDRYCRHLTVRTASGQLVACTRILTDEMSLSAGGFYSAGEFNLAAINHLPGRALEIGRTCVDAEFRSGAVIGLLWQGIGRFISEHGYDYLFGCASISLADGGASAHAILRDIRADYLAPAWQRVQPYQPLPQADGPLPEKPRFPPLLKAYLSLGARACGEAYWDRDFNCADVFMMLSMPDLHPRYARHFLGQSPAKEPQLASRV